MENDSEKQTIVTTPPIAQLAEQLPFKEKVLGSRPSGGTIEMLKTDTRLIERCQALRKKGATLSQVVRATKLPKTTAYTYIQDIPLPLDVQERIKKEATKRINTYIVKNRKGKCLPGREITKPRAWSNDLVFLTSHFMFDGRTRPSGCDYYNRSNFLIREVKKLMKKVFGLDSRIRKRKLGVMLIGYYNVELGAYFQEKVSNLPNYIINASPERKKIFLKAFFDDEGCVSVYKHNRKIKGYQHNLKILQLVQKLLADFGIGSKIDEKYKEIVISRKKNITRFRDKINFSKGIYINPDRKNSIWKRKLEKREILNKIIASYKS